MYDAHNKAALSGPHRKLKDKKAGRFSPSFGVHKGLIKDPNWPPAHFPEQGTAAQRRHRRVPCDFTVAVASSAVAVSGDLSRGGSMFMLAEKYELKHIEVRFGGFKAQAEVLSVRQVGPNWAYHCRFVDGDEAEQLWEAVEES